MVRIANQLNPLQSKCVMGFVHLGAHVKLPNQRRKPFPSDVLMKKPKENALSILQENVHVSQRSTDVVTKGL
jgi:hypothetical protein